MLRTCSLPLPMPAARRIERRIFNCRRHGDSRVTGESMGDPHLIQARTADPTRLAVREKDREILHTPPTLTKPKQTSAGARSRKAEHVTHALGSIVPPGVTITILLAVVSPRASRRDTSSLSMSSTAKGSDTSVMSRVYLDAQFKSGKIKTPSVAVCLTL